MLKISKEILELEDASKEQFAVYLKANQTVAAGFNSNDMLQRKDLIKLGRGILLYLSLFIRPNTFPAPTDRKFFEQIEIDNCGTLFVSVSDELRAKTHFELIGIETPHRPPELAVDTFIFCTVLSPFRIR